MNINNDLECFFIDGLKSLFNSTNKIDLELQEIIVKIYPDILIAYADSFNNGGKLHLLHLLDLHKVNINSKECWNIFLDNILEQFYNAYASDILANGKLFELAAKLRGADPSFDWIKYFERAINIVDTVNLWTLTAGLASSKVSVLHKDYFLKFLKANEFTGLASETRRNLYIKAIKTGVIDKKLARRMRSDNSERVSYDCLHNLFLYRDKFPHYNNLFMQFIDTNYDAVSYYLALNMPKENLPFLVALKHKTALTILEKRMTDNN